MKIGSLFSGLGGLELGLEWAGVGHTVWQCEQNTAAQAVLRRHWPGVPVYSDVRTIGASNVEPVDVLCGGFPCQDISVAGNGAGLEGARSGLWFEYLRLIRELRPRYVVAENVAALITRGLEVVLGGLAESGYDALWLPIRASDVGAPHRRERIFIVAWRLDVGPGRVSDADRDAVRVESERRGVGARATDERDAESVDVGAGFVGDANGARLERRRVLGCERSDQWTAREASTEGLADCDRLRKLQPEGGFGAEWRRISNGSEKLADPPGVRQLGGSPFGASAEQPRADGIRAYVERVHEWPPSPGDVEGWADYLARFPSRSPSVRGRLNVGFVEALMGVPDDWTDADVVTRSGARRTTRAERLKMCGNAVVPQCAEVVGHVLRGMM